MRIQRNTPHPATYILGGNYYEQRSENFDGLIGRKIPIADFEKEICRIMKKRSTSRLWYSNMPDTIRDINGKVHTVNFRCVPESPKCENMFCLVLEHEGGMVVIREGYLEKL